MSWSYPSTVDAPTFLAIAPDWSAGVAQTTTYRTDINRSRRGLEQRSQRTRRPALTMEYQWTANDAQARRRIENAVSQARGVIHVPWWPHGMLTQTEMISSTEVRLDSNPIAEEWDRDGWIYLWHRETGAEFRQVVSRNGALITLTGAGPFLLFPAGSHAFPVRLATREAAEQINQIAHTRTADETLTFRTL